MPELKNAKKQLIADLIRVEGMTAEDIYPLIAVPADRKMGDYAFPCFRLAKVLRKAPAQIAEDLKADVLSRPHPFQSVEAVNGYLNFKFDPKAGAAEVIARIVAQKNRYGAFDLGEGRTVTIDYSSVNIAKPFHIGHLSSTVIGGALYRIFKKMGFSVVGINHLGDWGTQFGKLIVAYRNWGDDADLAARGIYALNDLYVRYHREAEADPALDDLARAAFKSIEDNDPEALELFEMFKDITLRAVRKVYDRLDITFDSYNGEAFYNDKMEPVLRELEQKGLLVLSDGAKVVDLKDYGMPPCLLVRSDGATLYATRDLAAAFYRKNTYDFYKNLYVVAYQQNLHFRQLFKVLELMGMPWAKDCVHVAFGMVSLEEGTMSTRKGKVVWLNDVLNKAVEKSLAIITEKNSALPDKERVAEQVGVGAVVFFALSNNRIKDIVFGYDKVLNFDGETGPYLQYTNARCVSILKRKEDYLDFLSAPLTEAEIEDLAGEETAALSAILENMPAVLADVVEKYEPSLLSRYLIDVAQAFNRFYIANRIFDQGVCSRARLGMTYAVHTVLQEGLRLLGIGAPEEM